VSRVRAGLALATLAVSLLATSALSAVAAGPPDPASSDTSGYEYNPTGKRDPFRPLSLLRNPNAPAMENLSPLQRYEIGQLKLVGIIYNVTPPRAMVEDSSGLGFILTPGTPVGPNGGVVTAIEPRQVVVVEWYTDVIGEKHRKEYTLELPTDAVEGKR
jgi:type IV pilus assembly protein PilP